MSDAAAGIRKFRPCKETGHKITDRQRHFLAAFCDAPEVKRSQPRASTVLEAMKAKFGDLTLNPATQRPILLDETQLAEDALGCNKDCGGARCGGRGDGSGCCWRGCV